MTNDQQYDQGELDELNDALASQGTDELRIVEASDLDVVLTEIGGQAQSAVDVAAKIDAIEDALASVASDSLLVDSKNALDVSGATVAVQEDTALDVSAATVTADVTSQQGRNIGKARLMDSSNTLIEPAENIDGSSTTATTTTSGQNDAASVTAADGRTHVTAAWDISGSATITVEVSPDGGANWFQEFQTSPGSAETGTHNFSTGFDDVRIYVDSNLNRASIGAKGA